MKFAASRRRGLESIPRLPLVALIDVVLFILLYFMLAGSLNAEEAKLTSQIRATGAAVGKLGDTRPITVIVQRGERGPVYLVGDRTLSSVDQLSDVLLGVRGNAPVTVRVADTALVEDAAGALQAARDAGVVDLSYGSQ